MPIVHRYLWAQGSVSTPLEKGTLLAGRYQVLQFPLLLDTSPAHPPVPLETVPPLAQPYLSLSPFLVAVPRPFTEVLLPHTGESLLLLEEVPVRAQGRSATEIPSLLSTLPSEWAQASALKQVSWLWQIARLWQPFTDNQVAATLLDWQNVRVEAEDIRLLSLQITDELPTLIDLGHQWQPLVQTAAKSLRSYLTRLIDTLISGQGSAMGLVDSLTHALDFVAANQGASVRFATYSDQGPTRQRNEDACYPPSGSVSSVSVKAGTMSAAAPAPFVVVCDGIGGHQGGNIASQIAIDEVTQHLQAIISMPNLPHADIVSGLEQAIFAANQVITTRNDADQREDRDRMGTTIVIALIYGARLYIAHLGDSRAYRVRLYSCRQITLDDDVATRETRLGLGLYPDALQAPGSGALVQALGMADSRHLRPTVELYPLASESVFLLCSDGLSDHGLVEQLWTTELQPVVTGDLDVAAASKRLIELANLHNGHDNVTVSLLRVVPESSRKGATVPVDLASRLTAAPLPPPVATQELTPALPTRDRSWPVFSWLLIGAILAALAGVAAYYWETIQQMARIAPLETGETGETLSPSAAPPSSTQTPDITPDPETTQGSQTGDFSVGDYLQIQSHLDNETAATMTVTEAPPVPEVPTAVDLPESILPIGSIVQVIGRQRTPNNQLWVRLEVCSTSTEVAENGVTPEAAPLPTTSINLPEIEGDRALTLAQPGDQGWLLETSLPNFADRLLDTSPDQQGLCTD